MGNKSGNNLESRAHDIILECDTVLSLEESAAGGIVTHLCKIQNSLTRVLNSIAVEFRKSEREERERLREIKKRAD